MVSVKVGPLFGHWMCQRTLFQKVSCIIDNLRSGIPVYENIFCDTRHFSGDCSLQPQRSNVYVDNFNSAFVPPNSDCSSEDVEKLQQFVDQSRRLLVITGAGLSTESGIPDYRSEGVGLYARSNHRPMDFAEFLKGEKARQRYWARNFTGWPSYSRFQPNVSHVTLNRWEKAKKLHWLVTQNVDALHVKAGSERVTELHGSLYRVVCLSCHHKIRRRDLQTEMEALNPGWERDGIEIAPDGDVQLTQQQVEGFKVPACRKCGGVLKPDIVFFGGNVPRETVHFVFDRVAECDAMLVLGSSLQVYSGYRFLTRAHEQGKPIAVVNIGLTRADKLTDLKINSKCSNILRQIIVS